MKLVNEFDSEVVKMFNLGKKTCRTFSKAFANDMGKFGPYCAVRRLIANESGANAYGASRISGTVTDYVLKGHSDLLVENLVIDRRFSALFTDEEVNFCRNLLGAA